MSRVQGLRDTLFKLSDNATLRSCCFMTILIGSLREGGVHGGGGGRYLANLREA